MEITLEVRDFPYCSLDLCTIVLPQLQHPDDRDNVRNYEYIRRSGEHPSYHLHDFTRKKTHHNSNIYLNTKLRTKRTFRLSHESSSAYDSNFIIVDVYRSIFVSPFQHPCSQNEPLDKKYENGVFTMQPDRLLPSVTCLLLYVRPLLISTKTPANKILLAGAQPLTIAKFTHSLVNRRRKNYNFPLKLETKGIRTEVKICAFVINCIGYSPAWVVL